MIANDNVSLSIQALKLFAGKFKPVTSTQMKTAVAALYYAQTNGPFHYANIIGILQLDVDRKLKTKMLRIYNLQTMRLVFQIELYYDFAKNYLPKDDKFYYFQHLLGTVGLLFRNKQDADAFALKIKSQAPSKKQYQQLVAQRNHQHKKQPQQMGFMDRFKRTVFGQEPPTVQIVESGKVLNSTKLMTIQIDKHGNFQTNADNSFQKDILTRMGLPQKAANNPQLMKLMADNLFVQVLKKENKSNPQIVKIIKQAQEQQDQYLQDCRRSVKLNIPPPPPPLPIFSPSNPRMSVGKHGSLLQQIRNNNLKLKKVVTNEKGGIHIDYSSMDTGDKNDLAMQLKKKVQNRNLALNK